MKGWSHARHSRLLGRRPAAQAGQERQRLFAYSAYVRSDSRFSYYPFLQALHKSFFHWDGQSTSFAGLDNYKRMFTGDVELGKAARNQIVITVVSILKIVTVPLLVARLMFALTSGWATRTYRIMLLLPMTVPWIVMGYVWKNMYAPKGVFNTLLAQLGLESWAHNWLGDPSMALGSVLFIGFPGRAESPS